MVDEQVAKAIAKSHGERLCVGLLGPLFRCDCCGEQMPITLCAGTVSMGPRWLASFCKQCEVQYDPTTRLPESDSRST